MPDAREFFLTFGGTPVGDKIHSMGVPTARQVNEPRVIQAFRHKKVVLDNRYPALVYEYPFEIITIGSTIAGFVDDFYNAFHWMYDIDSATPTVARTLVIEGTISSTETDPVLSFGACYLASAELAEPEELLVHPMGILQVTFIGASKPELL